MGTQFLGIEPEVRYVGPRWLAVSPRSAPLQIGVVAWSEVDARERFALALVAWQKLRDGPDWRTDENER